MHSSTTCLVFLPLQCSAVFSGTDPVSLFINMIIPHAAIRNVVFRHTTSCHAAASFICVIDVADLHQDGDKTCSKSGPKFFRHKRIFTYRLLRWDYVRNDSSVSRLFVSLVYRALFCPCATETSWFLFVLVLSHSPSPWLAERDWEAW